MFNYLVDASLMKLLRLLRHERCRIDVIMAVTRPQWLHRSDRVMDGRSFCPTINPFIKCSFVGDLEPITLKHFRFLISCCVWKLQLELDQTNKHWQLNSLDKLNNSIVTSFASLGVYDFFFSKSSSSEELSERSECRDNFLCRNVEDAALPYFRHEFSATSATPVARSKDIFSALTMRFWLSIS